MEKWRLFGKVIIEVKLEINKIRKSFKMEILPN
jgi:hypothetical protein